jgi:pyridoxamine 5'-phosphate oxidase
MLLAELRENYTRGSLRKTDLGDCPLALFDKWLEEVIATEMPDANAMTLATVDESGQPSQRIVLLKGRPEDQFVFYTNYGSNKANDIAKNNKVSLHFPWYLMERQVLITGIAEPLSDTENDDYFSQRPKNSQLGAAVSQQSQPIDSRDTLVKNFEQMQQDYTDEAIPRPHWGGYAVTPMEIEFWQGGQHRLHDRFRFTRDSVTSPWQVVRLQP